MEKSKGEMRFCTIFRDFAVPAAHILARPANPTREVVQLAHGHSAKETAAVFAIGAVGYPLLELLWRRRTHASMALAGGLCFQAIYRIHAQRRPFLSRCARGALAVTGIELLTGLLVNRLLRLGVWDYSRRRFQLLGQVCAAYSALWFLLCALASPLCAKLRLYFSGVNDYNKA